MPARAKPKASKPKPTRALAPLRAAPPPASALVSALPQMPVIIIYSEKIADPQRGVKQLARISAELTTEFAARSATIDSLKAQAEMSQVQLRAATA